MVWQKSLTARMARAYKRGRYGLAFQQGLCPRAADAGAGGLGTGKMKHGITLLVRPYECDSYGHVNHAVYVNYLEHARMQYLHAIGFDYKGMIAAGFFTVITRLEMAYRLPAYADDELTIETEPGPTRRSSGVFQQMIRRGGDVIVEAKVHWCVVNGQGRPTRPPPQFGLGKLSG